MWSRPRAHEPIAAAAPDVASGRPVDLAWTTYRKALSVVRNQMKFLNAESKV